jgi:hypothetical protein
MGRNNADFQDGKEHVMDYEPNPKTGTWHEVVQTGDYMGAPVHTRLTPTKDMK